MRISLNWIEEILGEKLSCSAEELSEKLLALGFELSSCQIYPECSGVTVAQILEISKHPNADRLSLAKITDGKETETVVCGAPNIAIGQKVFWAKVGAQLTDGQTVKKNSIRGISSSGMLCSAKELGIGEDHAGIWILAEEFKPGKSLQEIVPLKDTILNIEVTPNRPDCLSHIGIAREIAIGLNLKILPLSYTEKIVAPELPTFPVEIEDSSGCFRYIARKLEGIRVAPSPLALQVRLLRCGIRPINNVVDITNLILLETGQPLHAFDLEKLEDEKIVVRRAKKGEKILALDGKNYDLTPEILVIADAKKPCAVAGVMGGEESAVNSSTKRILLESAVFDKRAVRKARKILNLSTESSTRFERGVTHWSCAQGSFGAEKMLCQISRGELSAYADVRISNIKTPQLSLRSSVLEKIVGEKISRNEIASLLEKLGVTVSQQSRGELIPPYSEKQGEILVQAPPWRTDLNLEIDFIEEIARLRNYEKVPSSSRQIRLCEGAENNDSFALRKNLRALLQALGFTEAVNYGLISKNWAAAFISEEFHLLLENSLSEEQEVLRPSLLPELLKNLKLNLSYQKKEIQLFEIGTVFQRIQNQPVENLSLAGIAMGNLAPPHWKQKNQIPIDFFWLRGVVEKIFSELQLEKWELAPFDDILPRAEKSLVSNLRHSAFLHPRRFYKVAIQTGGFWQTLGILGMLHPALGEELHRYGETALFELNLTLLEKAVGKTQKKFSPILRTPLIQRDCSIWIGREFSWFLLESEIRKAAGNSLKQIELFDLYSDPKQPGLKSLSFSLTFQHPEKTLSDEDANELRDAVIAVLHKKFKAELRERDKK